MEHYGCNRYLFMIEVNGLQKILFLVSSIGTSGGIQKNLSMISHELVEEKYDVSILSVFNYDKTHYKFNEKINCYTCGVAPANDLKKRFGQAYLKVNKALKKLDFDTLVIEGTGYATLIQRLWFRWKNVIVVDHEGLQFHSQYGLSRLGAKRSIKYASMIRVLTNLSRIEYEQMFSKPYANLHTIANPISKDIIYKPYDSASKRMLYVGRLDSEKGVMDLIESLIIIKQMGEFPNDWTVDIFGSGVLKRKITTLLIENNLDKQVNLKGFNGNIADIYSEYSFLVLPSMYESFGLVIVEALKSGIPIVAFDSYYGPKEIINNNVNGILVERRNVKSLANAILKLVNSKSLRAQLASNTQLNLEQYDTTYVVDQWKQMIES